MYFVCNAYKIMVYFKIVHTLGQLKKIVIINNLKIHHRPMWYTYSVLPENLEWRVQIKPCYMDVFVVPFKKNNLPCLTKQCLPGDNLVWYKNNYL